jgi:phosphoribosyl-ATP pyrophosphohydrolase
MEFMAYDSRFTSDGSRIDMSDILKKLAETLEARKGADPQSSYVSGLYAKGLDAILKKIGEEATETVLAAKSGERAKIVHETADLWFHTLIMLAQTGLKPDDILIELERRFGVSGLDEKAGRQETPAEKSR